MWKKNVLCVSRCVYRSLCRCRLSLGTLCLYSGQTAAAFVQWHSCCLTAFVSLCRWSDTGRQRAVRQQWLRRWRSQPLIKHTWQMTENPEIHVFSLVGFISAQKIWASTTKDLDSASQQGHPFKQAQKIKISLYRQRLGHVKLLEVLHWRSFSTVLIVKTEWIL